MLRNYAFRVRHYFILNAGICSKICKLGTDIFNHITCDTDRWTVKQLLFPCNLKNYFEDECLMPYHGGTSDYTFRAKKEFKFEAIYKEEEKKGKK